MKIYWVVPMFLIGGWLVPSSTCAQEQSAVLSPEEEAIHNDLRAMREALADAVLAGDIEAQLTHAHENVVVTWQNNVVSRGHDGLREFFDEMELGGTNKVFRGYTERPTSDELTILYDGDVGIAFGSSVPHYKILGMEFDLENRWTATLVKENDRWLLASYHVSGNLLDNPVLDIAKRGVYLTGGIAATVGLLIGFFGHAAIGRSRKRTS